MGEQNATATPPAASGGIDQEALSRAVSSALAAALPAAIASAVSEANRPLVEQLDKLQPSPAAASPAGGPAASGATAGSEAKYLTGEDLVKVLDEREQRSRQSAQQQAERQKFIDANLARLPGAYRNQLGGDPARWADEARRIESEFEADARAQPGAQPESRGGATADGGTTAAQQPVDKTRIDPVNRIAMGLKG